MSELQSMNDLFVNKLRDLLNAERQLLDALPKMARAASTPALRKAFEAHRKMTDTHVSRLKEVFGLMDLTPRGKACKGMEGLVEEGNEIIEHDGNEAVKDAGLISAAQAVEHYEIAGYGTAVTYAELLGNDSAAELLKATLAEEKATDKKLTELAERDVNHRAVNANGGSGAAEEAEEYEEE